MSHDQEIHLQREHGLGLARARELAAQWAEDAEEQYGMACRIEEGETSDLLYFSRDGVQGTLAVEPARLVLQARLGGLLAGFRQVVEARVARKLDELLALESQRPSQRKG